MSEIFNFYPKMSPKRLLATTFYDWQQKVKFLWAKRTPVAGAASGSEATKASNLNKLILNQFLLNYLNLWLKTKNPQSTTLSNLEPIKYGQSYDAIFFLQEPCRHIVISRKFYKTIWLFVFYLGWTLSSFSDLQCDSPKNFQCDTKGLSISELSKVENIWIR